MALKIGIPSDKNEMKKSKYQKATNSSEIE